MHRSYRVDKQCGSFFGKYPGFTLVASSQFVKGKLGIIVCYSKSIHKTGGEKNDFMAIDWLLF
jgi:hypothetical protein